MIFLLLSSTPGSNFVYQYNVMPNYTVCITGNIASGKSTLAQLLAQNTPHAAYVDEPHTINPFLSLYLRDKVRWGFTAQLRYFHDYAWALAEARASGDWQSYFVDTGMWTNLLVYARYLSEAGLMRPDEHDFYWTMCATIQRAYEVPDPNAYIFVKASPHTCWDRMQRRAWTYQIDAIDRAYIEVLNSYFEQMLGMVQQGVPSLVLSSEDIDFTSQSGRREALSRVKSFLDAHQLSHP
jgi:deoxyadenosine/deoxycytidine kinase